MGVATNHPHPALQAWAPTTLPTQKPFPEYRKPTIPKEDNRSMALNQPHALVLTESSPKPFLVSCTFSRVRLPSPKPRVDYRYT